MNNEILVALIGLAAVPGAFADMACHDSVIAHATKNPSTSYATNLDHFFDFEFRAEMTMAAEGISEKSQTYFCGGMCITLAADGKSGFVRDFGDFRDGKKAKLKTVPGAIELGTTADYEGHGYGGSWTAKSKVEIDPAFSFRAYRNSRVSARDLVFGTGYELEATGKCTPSPLANFKRDLVRALEADAFSKLMTRTIYEDFTKVRSATGVIYTVTRLLPESSSVELEDASTQERKIYTMSDLKSFSVVYK